MELLVLFLQSTPQTNPTGIRHPILVNGGSCLASNLGEVYDRQAKVFLSSNLTVDFSTVVPSANLTPY